MRIAVAVALATALLGATSLLSSGAAAGAGVSSPGPAPGCGVAAPEVLAKAAGEVATRIYGGELGGSETRSDQHQVESYEPLLSAVAGESTSAITAAVTSLVYSHTHIVRLRVTTGAKVLADVGGPYILAPVSGVLRLHGRTIAHYVLSVQDDLGYVKLVSRFLDVPLVMRVGTRQIPVEGMPVPGPASIPTLGPLTYRHVLYEAFSFNARSFPGGPLRISLLLPVPKALSAKPCPAIKSAELGHAAQLIAGRFQLGATNFSTYVKFTSTLTHGLLYVRAGSRQLAGSSRGPAKLPDSGAVRYRHRHYEVFSFLAPSSIGQVRVYQLVTP